MGSALRAAARLGDAAARCGRTEVSAFGLESTEDQVLSVAEDDAAGVGLSAL